MLFYRNLKVGWKLKFLWTFKTKLFDMVVVSLICKLFSYIIENGMDFFLLWFSWYHRMFVSESVYKNFLAISRKNVSFFKLYYKSFIKSEKPSAEIHEKLNFIQKIQICLQNFKDNVTNRSKIMKFSDKQKRVCGDCTFLECG